MAQALQSDPLRFKKIRFGEAVNQLTQPVDYSLNFGGLGLGSSLDPESRLDELQRELERCRRGPPPPVDVSGFNVNFEYQRGGSIGYDDRTFSPGLNYKF